MTEPGVNTSCSSRLPETGTVKYRTQSSIP